ncbi:chromate efflux transporter [Peribacillus sp. SCS-37]|uniref:chromate efflux transporter n=1 Tax=Paraperibacillus esterisolvens TaxID=3115296 RepID=UPI00390589E3
MDKHIHKRLQEIFLVSLRLGLTSFGGPIAHLGYFHEEYVRRRKWIDEKAYADLIALCQFLPGPASSQAGIGIGMIRGGIGGGIMAFLGFTLPSAIALILFALYVTEWSAADAGWIHGLKIVSVAVVAHAILGMAPKLASGSIEKTIALFSLIAVLLWPAAVSQPAIIIISGLIGYVLLKSSGEKTADSVELPISRRSGFIFLIVFTALLILLPVIRHVSSGQWLAMTDSLYRSGSLVFGGGHVVLPLLEREFVPAGWLDKETFLAGYGAAQAIPGPLFTFAAYLGAVKGGWSGGLLAVISIFLPAFLLIAGSLPFWNTLRDSGSIRGALAGVNAAVVGILAGALYDPIWTSTIRSSLDFAFAALLFGMLAFWKFPSWAAVIAGALGGWLLSMI